MGRGMAYGLDDGFRGIERGRETGRGSTELEGRGGEHVIWLAMDSVGRL